MTKREFRDPIPQEVSLEGIKNLPVKIDPEFLRRMQAAPLRTRCTCAPPIEVTEEELSAIVDCAPEGTF